MSHDTARLPVPPSLPPGYEFLSYLDGGGMAEVFVVRHIELGKSRALKVIGERAAQDIDFVRRFRREQQIAARLGEHPHIIDVHDFGQLHTGQPYAVLPYFERGSFAALGNPRTITGHRKMCSMLADIASALRSLAAQQPDAYVHRDLKPNNILVGEENGEPYGVLADFGLARAVHDASITQPLSRLLTPAYAAPEQFRGEPLTPRTDIYALGITTCQMFSGRMPFDAQNDADWEAAHRHAKPRVPTPTDERLVPVTRLIQRSLAKQPKARPDAKEWEDELRRVQRTLAT